MPQEQKRIFLENPYDLETFIQSIEIAKKEGKDLLFVDRVLAIIRLDPEIDITNLIFRTLTDLELIELNSEKVYKKAK
jgi:hypothetical protein